MGGDVNVQEVVEDRVRDADEEPRGENQAGGPDDKLVGEEDLDVGPGGVPDLPECNREACGLTGIEVGLLDLAARLKLLQGQRARSVVLAGDVHDGFIGLLVPADGDEELGCLAELQYEQTQQCGTHYYFGVRVPAVSPASVHPGGAVVWVGAGVIGNKGPRDQGGDCLTNSPPRSHGGVHVLVLGWEELKEDGHVGGNVTPGCNGGEKHEDAVHCITGGAAGEEAEEGREDQGRVEGDFPANQVGTKPKQNRTSDQPGVEDLCRHGIPTSLHLVVDVSLDCRLHHLHLRVDRVSEPGDAKELHVEPRKADLVDGIVHKVDFPLQRHVAVLDGREVLYQGQWEAFLEEFAGRLLVDALRVGDVDVVVFFLVLGHRAVGGAIVTAITAITAMVMLQQNTKATTSHKCSREPQRTSYLYLDRPQSLSTSLWSELRPGSYYPRSSSCNPITALAPRSIRVRQRLFRPHRPTSAGSDCPIQLHPPARTSPTTPS